MPFIGGTNDLSAKPEQYLQPSGPRNIVVVHRNEVILTSGSDLNVTTVSSGSLGNPWPKIIGTYMRRLFKGSWRPNQLREVYNRNMNGNYGAITSTARFSYRGREFGGIGSMPVDSPGTWRTPKHPTYNNLVPIVYGLRDIDPMQLAQPGDLVSVERVQIGPSEFVAGASASLQEKLL